MIISDTKKFVFIHIPKTGGMSIRSKLQRYATIGVWKHNKYPGKIQLNKDLSKHATAYTVKKYLREWNKYFKFAFVRNPWDWFISVYFYIKKDKADPRYRLANSISFEEFVDWFSRSNPNKYPIRNGQLHYIMDTGKNLLVDFIGRIENIEKDFAYVCSSIEIKHSISKLNTTKHGNYRSYYTNKTKKQIESMFLKDINFFRYKF